MRDLYSSFVLVNKIQPTSYNHQTNFNIQIYKQISFFFSFVYWDLLFVWLLLLGYCWLQTTFSLHASYHGVALQRYLLWAAGVSDYFIYKKKEGHEAPKRCGLWGGSPATRGTPYVGMNGVLGEGAQRAPSPFGGREWADDCDPSGGRPNLRLGRAFHASTFPPPTRATIRNPRGLLLWRGTAFAGRGKIYHRRWLPRPAGTTAGYVRPGHTRGPGRSWSRSGRRWKPRSQRQRRKVPCP